MRMSEARAYVRAIRNQEKRRYAEAYLAYLQGSAPEPDTAGFRLTFMGAQAVRLAFAQLDHRGRMTAR